MKQSDMEDVKRRIGLKITYYRAMRGFTQEEFAKRTGVSVQTLRNYESGRTVPSGEFSARAAKLLEMSPDRFLSEPLPENQNLGEYLFPDSVSVDDEEKERTKKKFWDNILENRKRRSKRT